MTVAMTALLATSSKSSTGGSSGGTTFIIFLVLIALVGYFLLIRPQKQKQRRQREQQSQIGVGDEIITVGGIVGRVIAVDADRFTILSGGDTVGFPAVGNEPTRLVLVRNAISRKVDPPVVTDADGAPEEGSTDESGGDTGLNYGSYDDDVHPDAHGNGNGATAAKDDWSAEGAENEGTTS
ncbi:MAG: preprotein translocase subunit YajC [Acidimicrobiales bacterium]